VIIYDELESVIHPNFNL